MNEFRIGHYDYDYCDKEDSDHLYEIFEVKGGKIVGYADSKEEAVEKIKKLESADG